VSFVVLVRALIVSTVAAVALLPACLAGAAVAPVGGAVKQEQSCSTLGSLASYDVFAAGNINVTNNQLQGGAAAGANVTMSSYGVSVGLPADGARLDPSRAATSTFRTLARTAACATAGRSPAPPHRPAKCWR
jgi:hypothetical protein